MRKKKYIYLALLILIILFAVVSFCYNTFFADKNFIKLDYDEIVSKIDNKETFALCVSRTTCVHCEKFKPKLKKISDDYNIKIYYADIDNFSKDDYKDFKDNFSFDGATPTTIFFKDGVEATTGSRIEGNTSLEKAINKFKSNGFIK